MNSKKLYIFNILIKFLPSSRCHALKSMLLRWCGAKVGKGVEIFTPSIQGDFDLYIGDHVFIGHEALLTGANGSSITIGNYAKIGTRSILVTGSHKYSIEYPSIAGPGTCESIEISEGASIGTNSIILPGKKIGFKAHIAAGAVVTKDVPDMVRVAGIPARIIKDFRNEIDKIS